MRKAVVAIILIWAILATMQAYQQQQEIHRMKEEFMTLKWQAYSNRSVAHNLRWKVRTLQEKLNKLEKENEKLYLKVVNLEDENSKLREKLNDTLFQLKCLKDKFKLYAQVPRGYYSTNYFPDHKNTVKALKHFLSKEFFVPHKYVPDVFDCSEIAAYTEWALEDAGFDAYIVIGYLKSGNVKGGHAWDMVKIGNSKYYIDASSGKPYLFKHDPLYIKLYVLKNIYDAIDLYGNAKEFDWWNVTGFPPVRR